MTEASSSVSEAHARKVLEDQIEVHARAIIDIKTRLNTMTPVARLPPELLSNIFTLVAAEKYEQKYHNPRYIETYQTNTWITAAHVCRHWRAIALSSPRFWSYITVTSKRATDEMLLRSKKAPLYVVAATPSYEDDRQKAVKGVMAEFARIRALQLTGSSQAICDLFKTVSAPAAMLESLKLSDRSSYYADTGIVSLVLPADGVPRLRNLEINGFSFAWDHPLFCPTLTSLLLHGRVGYEARPLIGSFETFLSALERMTGLQELSLEHVIPPAPSGPPSRKIPLMHLSSIRVVAGDAECRSLLNHLTLPPNVRYHLTVLTGIPGPDNLFLALKNHLSSSPPIRTACFDDKWTGRLSLQGWRAEMQPIPPREARSSSPDVELEIVTGTTIPALLRASTVFTGVIHLDIRMDDPARYWRWQDVFAGMPNIRSISVSKDQDTEFLDALCHTDGDDPATMALPHLEVLKFSNMRLASRDYDEPVEFLDVMVDALIKRCNCGFPLQELHIEECINTYQDDVEKLAEIVPDFHWDQVEEEEEYEEEEEEEEDYDYAYDYDLDDYDDYDPDEDDLMVDGGLFFGLY
ncbi:hypothetical protein C8T65DRAFT_616137 [Cerioporus squamosus]|nr:hypothetical protein C8T65DRAFT_616137 [Cerioporus squamosus]